MLGQLSPNSGEVRVDGKVTTGMRPCDLNRIGVSRTFQLLQVFPQLSVRAVLVHETLVKLFGAAPLISREAGDVVL